ncbi:hypothetical protein BGW38_009293 [Lunasporangiospora selenospora]|uniref:RlpA-like protein double-psi beta-barrel domain-containing protein n=1 Tax=Lunasporangiospora selenospora TaxID=979761 RepID=A0A9P6KG66_9FUNG|nr:hypothetical protein BGW38_009293 [Lunasporangiospora selenospora]
MTPFAPLAIMAASILIAMERFPDLHREMVPVEWQVVDAPIAESLDAPVSTAHNSLSKRAVKLKGKVFRGRGTWFSDTMGSCGRRFSQSDMIVALNQAQMGKMYGKGSKCGRKIRVTAKENPNRSVIVTIVDTCPNRYCRHGQLDLSRAAFKKFAPMKKGILSLQWAFV